MNEPAASGLPYPAEPPTTNDDLEESGAGSRASIWARAGARLVDSFLFIAVQQLVYSTLLSSYFVDEVREGREGEAITVQVYDGPWWPALLLAVAFAAYEVILIGRYGHTLGKLALNVKVVRWADGGPVAMRESLIRWAVPGAFTFAAFFLGGSLAFVLSLVPIAIYLSALGDPLYRGIHDKVAGTIVLRTR